MSSVNIDFFIERFLGPEGTEEDAEKFIDFLEKRGWEICEDRGRVYAQKDSAEMTESEWLEALSECF